MLNVRNPRTDVLQLRVWDADTISKDRDLVQQPYIHDFHDMCRMFAPCRTMILDTLPAA